MIFIDCYLIRFAWIGKVHKRTIDKVFVVALYTLPPC